MPNLMWVSLKSLLLVESITIVKEQMRFMIDMAIEIITCSLIYNWACHVLFIDLNFFLSIRHKKN